jgi:hypothetical protein
MLRIVVRRVAGVLILALLASLSPAARGSADPGQTLGTLTGRVVDDDGRAVRGVVVSVGGDTPTPTKTAADGTYTRTGIEPGRYRVNFFAPNDRYVHTIGVKVTIRGGRVTTLNARLRIAGALRGTVRDAAGRPAELVRVYLGDSPKPDRLTGRDGRFSIGGVAPGVVRIRLGYFLGGRFVTRPAGTVRVVAKRTSPVVLRLPKGAEARA